MTTTISTPPPNEVAAAAAIAGDGFAGVVHRHRRAVVAVAVGAAGAVVASTGAAPSSPSLERRSYWIDHQNHWTGNMHEKVRRVMYYVLLLLLYTVK
mgnify:FL=1